MLWLTAGAPAAPVPPGSEASKNLFQKIKLRRMDSDREVLFAEIRKPVTVVAIWTPHCPPCLKELRLLQQVSEHYKARADFGVVAVAFDPSGENQPEELAHAKEVSLSLHLTFPRLWDPTLNILDLAMKPDEDLALPVLVLIDREGHLLREVGFSAEDPTAYLTAKYAMVDRALHEKLPPMK